MTMTEKAKETVKISVGAFLQLGSILAITVLSFALVKAQADENSRNIVKHERVDSDKWVSNEKALDDIKNDVKHNATMMTELRISQREQATHYAHIIAELEEVKQILKTFEVAE